MKIEIDYEEVENLKAQILHVQKQRDDLAKRLDELDEKKLKKEATELALLLSNKYIEGIFKKLGFDAGNPPIIDDGNVGHWLGKRWYESNDLVVGHRVHITDKFRSAFLTLGIITKEEE